MKKLIILGAALATTMSVAGSALAADLPRRPVYKAPEPAPVANTWTGWYAGVNGGYAWGDDPTSTTGQYLGGGGGNLQNGNAKIHPDGGFLGVQAGYNMQVAPAWLVGFETDFQYGKITGTANCMVACNTVLPPVGTGYNSFATTDRLNWFGTARGRLGYIAGSSLFYATGGLAYGEVERVGSILGEGPTGAGGPFGPFAGGYDDTSTRIGWTVGGGFETKLPGTWSNWSAKAEYLYVDLGHVTDRLNEVYFSGNPGAFRDISSNIRENIFRVGLNYKFGG